MEFLGKQKAWQQSFHIFANVCNCSADWAFVQKKPAAKLDSELAEPSTLFILIAPEHVEIQVKERSNGL